MLLNVDADLCLVHLIIIGLEFFLQLNV